jgi:DNA-directed RNA polymerase beta' subunit
MQENNNKTSIKEEILKIKRKEHPNHRKYIGKKTFDHHQALLDLVMKLSDEENERFVDCKEYVIDTEGSNIPDIMALSFVDKSRTQTNDIRAIYKHYGVEAAKAAIIREINGVMTFNGVYVDLRHIRLIADQMTYKGVLAAINRHGQKLTEASPLMKSSFECTVQTLVKSGVRSAIDNMNGITPNVMIGQTARFGTNFAEYQMDY